MSQTASVNTLPVRNRVTIDMDERVFSMSYLSWTTTFTSDHGGGTLVAV
jgi:hypothetical protein